MKILAISGSLRPKSSNTALLRAAVELAPEAMQLTIYDGIGKLPHFNPDIDTDEALSSVMDLRSQLHHADGVLFCPDHPMRSHL